MRWLASLGQFLRSFPAAVWRWLAAPLRRRRLRVRYHRVEDFPDTLKPSTIYVAGEEPHAWAAAMLCPCGCGDLIELNLLKDASPCWTVKHHPDGSVSLMPSVWRTKGCRSHFFVRNSYIDWCGSQTALSSGRIPRR